jgi:hypothetical protein
MDVQYSFVQLLARCSWFENTQFRTSVKTIRGEFPPVPNIKHTWRKSIELDGSEFVVVAVQTQL